MSSAALQEDAVSDIPILGTVAVVDADGEPLTAVMQDCSSHDASIDPLTTPEDESENSAAGTLQEKPPSVRRSLRLKEDRSYYPLIDWQEVWERTDFLHHLRDWQNELCNFSTNGGRKVRIAWSRVALDSRAILMGGAVAAKSAKWADEIAIRIVVLLTRKTRLKDPFNQWWAIYEVVELLHILYRNVSSLVGDDRVIQLEVMKVLQPRSKVMGVKNHEQHTQLDQSPRLKHRPEMSDDEEGPPRKFIRRSNQNRVPANLAEQRFGASAVAKSGCSRIRRRDTTSTSELTEPVALAGADEYASSECSQNDTEDEDVEELSDDSEDDEDTHEEDMVDTDIESSESSSRSSPSPALSHRRHGHGFFHTHHRESTTQMATQKRTAESVAAVGQQGVKSHARSRADSRQEATTDSKFVANEAKIELPRKSAMISPPTSHVDYSDLQKIAQQICWQKEAVARWTQKLLLRRMHENQEIISNQRAAYIEKLKAELNSLQRSAELSERSNAHTISKLRAELKSTKAGASDKEIEIKRLSQAVATATALAKQQMREREDTIVVASLKAEDAARFEEEAEHKATERAATIQSLEAALSAQQAEFQDLDLRFRGVSGPSGWPPRQHLQLHAEVVGLQEQLAGKEAELRGRDGEAGELRRRLEDREGKLRALGARLNEFCARLMEGGV